MPVPVPVPSEVHIHWQVEAMFVENRALSLAGSGPCNCGQQQQHKSTLLGGGTANGVEFIRVFEKLLESIELECIARRAVEVSTHAGAFPSHQILRDHSVNETSANYCNNYNKILAHVHGTTRDRSNKGY